MSCSLIVSNGGIYAILNGMSEQMGKSEVLEAGILCLRTLSVGKEGMSAIHKGEGLRNIISAMSAHPQCASFQENALEMASGLWSDTRDYSSTCYLVEDSDVKVIVKSMETHPISTWVQRWGCICLYNMSKGSQGNRLVIKKCSFQVADLLTNACDRPPQEFVTSTFTILLFIRQAWNHMVSSKNRTTWSHYYHIH